MNGDADAQVSKRGRGLSNLFQLAKLTFRSRYAHTSHVAKSENQSMSNRKSGPRGHISSSAVLQV